MNGKLVQSLINLFPFQHQDTIIKCVFIIGFDKLIKKGYFMNGKPKIQEIVDYASKLQQHNRLQQVQEPCDLRYELDQLKDEISKLTQQIQYNNSMIQRQTQRSHDRLLQNISPLYDDRKRSASVGFKQQQQQFIQKKTKEITPKVTETVPQTINQIHITISKHHLDDTEIKSVMRDNQIRDKPPKPIKTIQDQHLKKNNFDNQHLETEEAPIFEDTDRYPVRDQYIPQVLQYSQLQHSQLSQQQQQQSQQSIPQLYQQQQSFSQQQQSQQQQQQQSSFSQQQTFIQQQQQLQQSQISSSSNTKQSEQQSHNTHGTHNTHNTNQTFAQPQSSSKQLLQSSKLPNSQQRSPNKSPKFKYQSKQQSKRNLETVQEESSSSQVKHQSSHSASSKGRASHRQQQIKTQSNTQCNTQAVSKIKALLDQDKKKHKQHQLDIVSERGSFLNSSEKLKQLHEEQQQDSESQNKFQNSELSDSVNKRTFSKSSFYKQYENTNYLKKEQLSPECDPKFQAQYNQFQGSISMTNSNRQSNFVANSQLQDNILIYNKYKQQVMDQYSPKLKYQFRPSSVGKQQESDLKRSDDFNRSSVSSTFSMFNPNDELKTFFQNDFLERKRYTPYNDVTKQSSLNSSQEHNQHQSKYITASQIEEQQNYSKNIYSPQQYQNIDKSNVFNNNRLSVTRILNNSQI